jgi:hypothetical protein
MESPFMMPNMPLLIPSALFLKMLNIAMMKNAIFVSASLTAALPPCDLPSGATASAFSALVIGGKGRSFMKRTIKYTDEPFDVDLNGAKIINDFLPPPDKLVFKEKTVKITLNVSESSILFFKREAERQGVKYQQMLRALIDKYVSAHSPRP